MRGSLRSWGSKSRLGAAAATGCAGAFLYNAHGRRQDDAAIGRPLNPHSFTPFKLVDRERVSESNSILTLHAGHPHVTHKAIQDLWHQGVWSVEIKQPQLMIARRYTPLPAPSGETTLGNKTALSGVDAPATNDTITLLVKREPQGEVSRYLHALPVGALVEVRGSYNEYRIPDDVREVVFIAGGTGIAPALQVARALQERRVPTRMNIVWANRTREECEGGMNPTRKDVSHGWLGWLRGSHTTSEEPQVGVNKNAIVQRLDALASDPQGDSSANQAKIQVETTYFVDEEGTFINQKDVDRLLQSRAAVNPERTLSQRKLVLVSGPEGFISHVAGSKFLVNGVETQGRVGGLLSRATQLGWQVHKL